MGNGHVVLYIKKCNSMSHHMEKSQSVSNRNCNSCSYIILFQRYMTERKLYICSLSCAFCFNFTMPYPFLIHSQHGFGKFLISPIWKENKENIFHCIKIDISCFLLCIYVVCVDIFTYIYLILGNKVARKVKRAMFSCKIITAVIKYNPMFCISSVKFGYISMS